MGLAKQYLRYAPDGVFNIIASERCNCIFVPLNGVNGRHIAAGTCENVTIWDLRLGEKAQVLVGEKSEVSQLAASPTGNHIAVGYVDGVINVYNLTKNEVVCVFALHKSTITCMQYDKDGHRLVTGSLDTDVILWDVILESSIARFRGHRDEITSVAFINSRNCLVSTSKDSFIKFWDISVRSCFKTLKHLIEVWGGVLVRNDQFLVTGSIDQKLRVWKLAWSNDKKENATGLAKIMYFAKPDKEKNSVLQCHYVGSMVRGGRGRLVGLVADSTQSVIACFGTDAYLETFKFFDVELAKRRMHERNAKIRARLSSCSVEGLAEEVGKKMILCDLVIRTEPLQFLGRRLKSACLVEGSDGGMRLGISINNNRLLLYKINTSNKNIRGNCLKEIVQCGHRSTPRTVAFSSDNLVVMSAAVDSLKLWSRLSQKCVRSLLLTPKTIPRSACFAPGDRHAIVGCANGVVLIVDVASADILEEIKAHAADVWCVGPTADQRGFYTGSADKTVKIWQFEEVEDETGDSKGKVLSAIHMRTLVFGEHVQAVKMSPNGKFIAVGLMDSTILIFFQDTFKFYLSLCGHKCPVTCLDISFDSDLIATGSSDGYVKVWGMDFGDCHRSIVAHNDAVSGVQFVPQSHYFFTCSKDGNIKQWDGETFENIMTMQGHIGEAWALAVSAGGLYVGTAGSDNAIRIWSQTDDPIVLAHQNEEQAGLAAGDRAPVPGLPNITMPTKKTIDAEEAADSMKECLQIGEEYELELVKTGGKAQPPLLMSAYKCTTPQDFFFEILRKIQISELEEAVLLLPWKSAVRALELLPLLLGRRDALEIVCRLCVFILRMHHTSIVANHMLFKQISKLQKDATAKLAEYKDIVGFNVHTLKEAGSLPKEHAIDDNMNMLFKR